MNSLIIICYIIACYGLSNMVVHARGPLGIFEGIRKLSEEINEHLGEMFSCMICFPTWVGLGMSTFDVLMKNVCFTPFNLLIGTTAPWWLVIAMDGVFTSGVVWLIHNFEEACERHGDYRYEDPTDEE